MPHPAIRFSGFADARQIMLVRFLEHGRGIVEAAWGADAANRRLPIPSAERTDHLIVWQLYANATRECGRSPRAYRTEGTAFRHAQSLLDGVDRLETHEVRSPARGHGWLFTLDGRPVLVSSRWFGTANEALRSLNLTIAAVGAAGVVQQMRRMNVRRPGPLDVLEGSMASEAAS